MPFIVTLKLRCERLPEAELVCEVQQRADCSTGGEEHSRQCHLLEMRERAVAVGACVALCHESLANNLPCSTWRMRLTLQRNIRLFQIHAKRKPTKRAQLPRLRRRRNTSIRIINNEFIILCQKGRLPVHLFACIPQHFGLLGRHVDGDGVGGLVGGAGGEHVDGGRRAGERSVVPRKGHPVADFVELRPGDGGGRYHCEAARGQARVVGCGF